MKATTCRNLRHCRANSDLYVIVRISLIYLHGQVTVRIATARLQGYLYVTVRIAHKISARDRVNSICQRRMPLRTVKVAYLRYKLGNYN